MRPLPDEEAQAAFDQDPAGASAKRNRAGDITWRLIVLLVVLAGVALLLANGLRVYVAQSRQLAEVRGEIASQEAQIADLEDQLNRWNDPEYVRSLARSKLGWVMPGEVGYRVIGPDGLPLDGSETVEAEPESPELLWWESLVASIHAVDQPVEEVTPEPVPADDPDRVVGPSASPSPEPGE
ncbi:MAG TPA: septum formation initiator family protein [Arachnia sp.]|nr:septum formation initiator family protein [Arachnia sp.]HMT85589.1 septum formation initiator family protein [Arachnia sp.]